MTGLIILSQTWWATTYTHTYINPYVRTYMPTHIHTCMPAYTHTCIHAYIHMNTYIHTCIHTCIDTYEYIHPYMHTYMHRYIWIHINTANVTIEISWNEMLQRDKEVAFNNYWLYKFDSIAAYQISATNALHDCHKTFEKK